MLTVATISYWTRPTKAVVVADWTEFGIILALIKFTFGFVQLEQRQLSYPSKNC